MEEQNEEKSNEEVREIKSKTKHGLISLFSRSFFIYLLRATSILMLARFLEPEDYGVFGILNSWVWAIHLFLPDFSMFTALIQQKLEPSKLQMRNLYGVCLYRSSFIVIFFIAVGNLIIDYHKLDQSAYLMLVALSFAIFFDGIRTPFRMSNERKLNFKAIVFIEVSETILMYIAQISSAWMGAGTWSFVIALVTRSFSGFLLYYLYEKKLYLPIISLEAIKERFHFEIMVQLKKVLIGIKGLIVPIVLGRILSTNELGIVMWSIGIASIPIILAMNYDRVLFPALSKLQSNAKDFKIVASKGMEYSTLGLGFLFGLIACSANPAIQIFFPEKWEGAIGLLPLCCFAFFLAQIRYLGASIMNASGNPKKLLFVEGTAIILEFSLAIPATLSAQGLGYLYALIVVEIIMCIITFKVNQQYLRIETLRRILSVVVSSLGCYFTINFILNNIAGIMQQAVVVTFCFPILFVLLIVIIDPSVSKEIKNLLVKFKVLR